MPILAQTSKQAKAAFAARGRDPISDKDKRIYERGAVLYERKKQIEERAAKRKKLAEKNAQKLEQQATKGKPGRSTDPQMVLDAYGKRTGQYRIGSFFNTAKGSSSSHDGRSREAERGESPGKPNLTTMAPPTMTVPDVSKSQAVDLVGLWDMFESAEQLQRELDESAGVADHANESPPLPSQTSRSSATSEKSTVRLFATSDLEELAMEDVHFTSPEERSN